MQSAAEKLGPISLTQVLNLFHVFAIGFLFLALSRFSEWSPTRSTQVLNLAFLIGVMSEVTRL